MGIDTMKRLSALTRAFAVFSVIQVMRSYLDPGSGSLIVQILIAIVVGIAATFRLWKSKLLSLFGIKQEPLEDEIGDENETQDEVQA